MSSLHGLALFCAICFASLRWAHPTKLPSNMNDEIKRVKDDFQDFNKENILKWFGNPLFLKKPDLEILEKDERNLLVGEMLWVSERVLSNLLNHTKNATARSAISALKHRVEKMQREEFPAMKPEIRARLRDLWAIKVDELVTQLQAVRELSMLYSKADKLANASHEKTEKMRIRRRRRQVIRCKGPQWL